MFTKNKPLVGLLALLGPTYAVTAHAEVYMSEEQAAKTIFAGEIFKKMTLEISADDIKSIEASSGETVRAKNLTIYKSSKDNLVFIDQVLGKHEFITYAVGVSNDASVKGIEIVEYRETYGHQVRKESWRKQFVGKKADAELKIDKDITNISGATLSSAHVTAGVRRILKTYDVIKKRL